MAWNEPGGNKQDPWGGKRGGDGPPDLDEALKKFQEKLNGMFGGGNSGNSGSGGSLLSGIPIGLILIIAATIYGIAGFYQVNEQERAVVLRLGTYHSTIGPGLHWNPPLIDAIEKVNVTRKRLHSTKGTMLTEDLNIVDIRLSVQYTIGDARDFALNVRSPEVSLYQATDSALRHVVGSNVMHSVLTEGRQAIASDVQSRLQQYLDAYQTGILVDKVNVEDSAPPSQVQAAFDDVNKAREDEERVKNEAQTYANGVVPEARGRAQRMIEEANAYREQVIARAQGDAQRFEKLLVEYQKATEVTRERLYLDAVQEVMANSSKVLVDIDGGNNMMYLPLDKLMERSTSAPGYSGATAISPELLREITDRVSEQVRRDVINSRTSRGSR
ncbi:FtsH protease activity modulator HflK [Marinibactrum halimedae]|uniref:Protein HflK n=1 Tax=Marinibactrum halimedae TaxID=1444977 RepID=A0AA37T3Y4_9GAMM|nr:FtsH protease activity modulator HflK [Marinibactrum halimedae]MCD9459720.1 FtsH protease activity modulator HflK [Marinibactrum halimedae]GLS24523.1 protease modulator HflK [Marinibactrum halimedae]